GGGVPGRQQELPGDDPVRDAVLGRVASSHDSGGSGPPVRDAGAEAASKKNSGADVGSDGAPPGGGAGGTGAEAAPGDGAGGLPRASQRGCPEIARQDVAGQTPGPQIPAAVEIATEQKTTIFTLTGVQEADGPGVGGGPIGRVGRRRGGADR